MYFLSWCSFFLCTYSELFVVHVINYILNYVSDKFIYYRVYCSIYCLHTVWYNYKSTSNSGFTGSNNCTNTTQLVFIGLKISHNPSWHFLQCCLRNWISPILYTRPHLRHVKFWSSGPSLSCGVWSGVCVSLRTNDTCSRISSDRFSARFTGWSSFGEPVLSVCKTNYRY